MGVIQGAIVRVTLRQWRDRDLGQGVAEVVLVHSCGLVGPNKDRTVVLVSLGGHDLWNNRGKEVVPLCDVGRIAGVMNSIIGKATGQCGVHVVVLVRGNVVVQADGVVFQVGLQLL